MRIKKNNGLHQGLYLGNICTEPRDYFDFHTYVGYNKNIRALILNMVLNIIKNEFIFIYCM